MQLVKYLFLPAILFASCRSVRQHSVLPVSENALILAHAVSPSQPVAAANAPKTEEENIVSNASPESNETNEVATNALPQTAKATTKKVTSFTHWKEMAANGELKMSKKDVKMLNKLEKKYKGNFEDFKADTFEFTTKAKIVAGVGILGLLLAIFTGSWFGAFLFILAALGFILRFLGVIEF